MVETLERLLRFNAGICRRLCFPRELNKLSAQPSKNSRAHRIAPLMAAILYEGVVPINAEFDSATADQVLRKNRNQYSRTSWITGLPRKNSEAKLSNPKTITSKNKKKNSAPIFCDIASIEIGRA